MTELTDSRKAVWTGIAVSAPFATITVYGKVFSRLTAPFEGKSGRRYGGKPLPQPEGIVDNMAKRGT